MAQEYTKEEMIALLQSVEINGKISINDLSELVFDERFPNELFENAKIELISTRDDIARFKELGSELMPYWSELIEIQQELLLLRQNPDREKIFLKKVRRFEIENLIRPLENEFDILTKRIEQRTKNK